MTMINIKASVNLNYRLIRKYIITQPQTSLDVLFVWEIDLLFGAFYVGVTQYLKSVQDGLSGVDILCWHLVSSWLIYFTFFTKKVLSCLLSENKTRQCWEPDKLFNGLLKAFYTINSTGFMLRSVLLKSMSVDHVHK